MEILWIFAGIIYVVYKLFKERSFEFTWKRFFGNILTILPVVIGGIIISLSKNNQSIAGMIIGACILFFGFIFAFFYFQSKDVMSVDTSKNHLYSLQEVQQEFLRCGYDNIKQEKIENLINSPYSPLRTLKLASAGTVIKCYKWMCDQDAWEIDKLSRDDIGIRLGIPLDEIPLDQSIPLGEASLKRTTLAKDRLLKKDGLRYLNYRQYLTESDEYSTTFNCFVDKYLSEHH